MGRQLHSHLRSCQRYGLETATLDGVDVTAQVVDDVLTVNNVKANKTVGATFKRVVFNVTISGGGITVSNSNPRLGENVTVTIEDDPDRTLVSLIVNGQDVTAQVVNGQYVIQNVTGDVTIEATFKSTKEFITMTGDYATFSCSQDLNFTGSDLRAYIASGFNKATSQVGVLNMGIGGNCVLRGGLGPTGEQRYPRDLFGQEGVKWMILFEAVNDLGGSRNGVQTAERVIEVYKRIIAEAHEKGIRVFGATITPFKGNNYYSEDHEKGRSTLNEWIRTTDMLDGVIDFDKAVRNPEDPEALQRAFLFENDWLHLNAQGYETMGNSIDLNLFK